MKFYYTYVLLSKKDGQLYVGWTDNLRHRFVQHSQGAFTATKYRRPLAPVYYEACLSKEAAIEREKYFKSGFGRRFLKDRIRARVAGGATWNDPTKTPEQIAEEKAKAKAKKFEEKDEKVVEEEA